MAFWIGGPLGILSLGGTLWSTYRMVSFGSVWLSFAYDDSLTLPFQFPRSVSAHDFSGWRNEYWDSVSLLSLLCLMYLTLFAPLLTPFLLSHPSVASPWGMIFMHLNVQFAFTTVGLYSYVLLLLNCFPFLVFALLTVSFLSQSRDLQMRSVKMRKCAARWSTSGKMAIDMQELGRWLWQDCLE